VRVLRLFGEKAKKKYKSAKMHAISGISGQEHALEKRGECGGTGDRASSSRTRANQVEAVAWTVGERPHQVYFSDVMFERWVGNEGCLDLIKA
jgi:hypothetical protein